MRNVNHPTIFADFDESIDPKNYFIESYLQGSEICQTKGLNFSHFDHVNFFRKSTSQLTEIPYVHAIGSRIKDKQSIMLILKKRKR